MTTNLREIVNGSQLSSYVGKKVSITGQVNNLNPNGLTFDLKTTDDKNIKVSLKKPQEDILEGFVEVHGTSQGNYILCDEIIQWKTDSETVFDQPAHNSLCALLNSVPRIWETDF